MRRKGFGMRTLVATLVTSFLLVGGCGDDDGGGKPAGSGSTESQGGGQPAEGESKEGSVSVELTEWAVTGDPSVTRAGDVQFNVGNIGSTTHELVVIKTDLGVTELPIAASGFAEEKGAGIEVVDRTKEIQAGKSLSSWSTLRRESTF